MSDTLNFGISKYAGDFIDEVSVKEGLEIVERKNSVGVTAKVYPVNPKSDVTIKGGGTPIMALGAVETPGVAGITGGVFIVKEREATEGNEKFNEFNISATHFPSATLGTASGPGEGGGGA